MNNTKKMQSPGYKESKYNKVRVVIVAQTWEWYGTEDKVGMPGEGRYKAKGASEFVTWVPNDMYWYEGDKVKEAFDKKMNVNGEFFKYTAVEVKKYYAPEEVELTF